MRRKDEQLEAYFLMRRLQNLTFLDERRATLLALGYNDDEVYELIEIAKKESETSFVSIFTVLDRYIKRLKRGVILLRNCLARIIKNKNRKVLFLFPLGI